jgi:hypothetical protein
MAYNHDRWPDPPPGFTLSPDVFTFHPLPPQLKELREAFEMLFRIEHEMAVRCKELRGILDEASLALKELLDG